MLLTQLVEENGEKGGVKGGYLEIYYTFGASKGFLSVKGMNQTREIDHIKALRQGSRSAFNALYGMYVRRLFGFCYHYTRSREDAEEVVQDVFVKLWANHSSVREEESLLPYLFRIAKNDLINRMRERVNSPIYEEYVESTTHCGITHNDGEEKLTLDDFKSRLHHAIAALPQTQQKIVRCRLFEELSHKEMEEKLNLNEQTIRNQLSMAMKALRERFGRVITILWGIF